MKLIQKASSSRSFEFTIRDRCLHVKRSSRTASTSFDIPFATIDPSPFEHEQRGIAWYLVGTAMIALGLLLLALSFSEMAGEDRLGLLFGAVLAEGTALVCWAQGRNQTFSQIIFCSAKSGGPLIHLAQQSPSPVHVQEFVEILQEKIQAEADESMGYTENWRD